MTCLLSGHDLAVGPAVTNLVWRPIRGPLFWVITNRASPFGLRKIRFHEINKSEGQLPPYDTPAMGRGLTAPLSPVPSCAPTPHVGPNRHKAGRMVRYGLRDFHPTDRHTGVGDALRI